MTDETDSSGGIDDETTGTTRRSSRRRVLLGTATLAATGLAGCNQIQISIGSGTDEPDEDDGDAESGDGGADADTGGGSGGASGGGDGDGDGGSTPAGTDVPTGPDVTAPTPVDCEAETISSNIEADTTWDAADCPRVAIDTTVRVQNGASLTIEPGVEVVGLSGARLKVHSGGRLRAAGDPGNPVWFHGESDAAGYWQGIEVGSGGTAELDNVIVRHGGHNDWSNVYLDGDGQAALTNVLSERSSTSGLIAETGTTLSACSANEFNRNEAYAISIPTTHVGSLDGTSAYTGENATDAVHVFHQEVTSDASWPALPYHLSGNVHRLAGAVTVTPGAQFTVGPGGRIQVQQSGSLTAEGTSDSPITFAGETGATGYWQGIRFRSNTPTNSLDHVEVAHGGHNDWSNVYLDGNAQVSITNSSFAQSSTSGLVAESGTSFSGFAANEFADNEAYALSIPTTHVGSIDAGSTYAGGNATDAVHVFHQEVTDDATWPAVPYRFSGNVHRIAGAVTVDPGAQFAAGQGCRIQVQQSGSLTAEGTSDAPITFAGATASPGHWQGIRFRSNNPNNILNNAVVSHGGNNGWANVYLDGNASATVTNCTLSESSTWGLYADDGTTLDASSNVYENNGEGGVRTPEA